MRSLFLLLRRNCLKRMRSPCASCVEFSFPILVVGLFILMFSAFTPSDVATSQYIGNTNTISSLVGAPLRLLDINARIAIVPGSPSMIDTVLDFNDTLSQWFPGFDPALASFPPGSPLLTLLPRMPSIADVIEYYDSEEELEAYIRSTDYPTPQRKKVFCAIVFYSKEPAWNYSIRFNATEMQMTMQGGAVDNSQVSLQLQSQSDYVSPSTLYFPYQKPITVLDGQWHPGFMAYQLLVDKYIIRKPISSIPSIWQSAMGNVLSYVIPSNRSSEVTNAWWNYNSNWTAVLAMDEYMKSVFQSDFFSPQQVSVMPFPTTAYITNNFYVVAGPIFPFIFSFSFLYPAARLIRDIVSEKELRIREVMRAMGLPTGTLMASWFVTYILITLSQAIVITGITSQNIFKHSNHEMTFCLFALFGYSTVCLCMLITVFFSKAKPALILGLVFLFGSIAPYVAVTANGGSLTQQVLASIVPSSAFSLTLSRFSSLEYNGQGASAANAGNVVNNYSISIGFGMMAGMGTLFLLLTWYLDNVLPTEYGVPQPPLFCFTRHYWASKGLCRRVRAGSTQAQGSSVDKPVSSTVLEPADGQMLALESAGKVISIASLRKEYKSNTLDASGYRVAVDSVDLTMYEGQIFVLLGHNGAGKTTLVSMLTGLVPATSGHVSMYGYSVPDDLEDIRSKLSLGVCPQHDVLYPDLTVTEHLELYAGLKGVPPAQVHSAVKDTIAMVGLTDKANTVSAALSGGMKRKLSVGIALIGGSKVVVLDEPTSGMDPFSRRSTWQMLKNAREGRIMILTTHFMDEADLLGDRIAIMSNGKVVCAGSSLFLKRMYGVGYQLTVVKQQSGCDVDRIRSIIEIIPGAKLASNVGTELSFQLPIMSSPSFPAVMAQLEASCDALGMISFGIGVTTLEEVFLRVSRDSQEGVDLPLPNGRSYTPPVTPSMVSKVIQVLPSRSNAADTADATLEVETTVSEIQHSVEQRKGIFLDHMKALLYKRLHIFLRDLKGFLFLIFIPVVIVFAIVEVVSSSFGGDIADVLLSTKPFNLGQPVPDRVPYLDYRAGTEWLGPPEYNDIIEFMGAMASITPLITPVRLSNTTATSNATGFLTPSQWAWYQPVVGSAFAKVNDFLIENKGSFRESVYGAFAFFDPVWNGGPVDELVYMVFYNSTAKHSPAVFMNLMNSAIAWSLNGSSITTHNHPLPNTSREQHITTGLISFFTAIGVVIGFAFISGFYASFLVLERETNVKHMQLISGISIPAYWFSTFLWDFTVYQIPMWLTIAILKGVGVHELIVGDAFIATILLFETYGLATAGFTYLVSFCFKSAPTAQNVVIFLNVIGMFLIMASFVMSQLGSTCHPNASLQYVFSLLPAYAIGFGLIHLSFLTFLGEWASICNPNSDLATHEFTPLEIDAAGFYIVYMAVTGCIYFTIALSMDYLLSNPWLRAKFVSSSKLAHQSVVSTPALDSDVLAEQQRVASSAANTDLITLQSLQKQYSGGKRAVRGLSFGVPLGQCFGFLGINGAGKTTTLKILSGELLPTGGTAKIAGLDVLTQQLQVRRLLGYCPQFDALFDLLTVEEHLLLYAGIKQVPITQRQSVVLNLIQLMDLTAFQWKRAGTLSGGNKRKLSLAIALIGEPPVLFLDEPSTGVDPLSRRRMWDIISKVASERKICSVMLTSHSMEECEALCSRIGIMVDGQLKCLGSGQHLKAKFGSGYSCEMRLGAPNPNQLRSVQQRISLVIQTKKDLGLDVASIATVCQLLDNEGRAQELTEKGSGWVVLTALNRCLATEGTLIDVVPTLSQWWAEEDQADALIATVCSDVFPSATLLERHGSKFVFHISGAMALSEMFQAVERSRDALNIIEYSLSQTTLEQIFNKFAAQQEAVTNGNVSSAEPPKPLTLTASGPHEFTSPPNPIFSRVSSKAVLL